MTQHSSTMQLSTPVSQQPTTNETLNDGTEQWQATLRFMRVSVLVTMTLALVGNAFLAFVIVRGRTVKLLTQINPMHMLILHNCIADILFALITLLPTLVVMNGVFHNSQLSCKVTQFFQVIPMYASPFLLVAISADRYQAICRPFANLRDDRHRRARIYALVCWLLSLVCSLPQLLLFRLDSNHNCHTDHLPKWVVRINVIYFNAVAWLVPSSIAAYLYTQVCRTVWHSLGSPYMSQMTGDGKHKRFGRGGHSTEVMRALAEGSARTASIVYVEKLRKTRSFQKRIDEQERKKVQTVKLTLTIVACNFFLWAPFCISNVLYSEFPRLLNPKLIMYIMLFGNLNSCVNPWIFVFFNRPQVKRACCGRGDYREHSTGTLRTNNTTTTPSAAQSRNVSRNTIVHKLTATQAKKPSSNSLISGHLGRRSGTFAGPYSPPATTKMHTLLPTIINTHDVQMEENRPDSMDEILENGMLESTSTQESHKQSITTARRYMMKEISDLSIDFIDQETARSTARHRLSDFEETDV